MSGTWIKRMLPTKTTWKQCNLSGIPHIEKRSKCNYHVTLMNTINIIRWYSENANIPCITRVTSNQLLYLVHHKYRFYESREK
jgi:hypothetical protein